MIILSFKNSMSAFTLFKVVQVVQVVDVSCVYHDWDLFRSLPLHPRLKLAPPPPIGPRHTST